LGELDLHREACSDAGPSQNFELATAIKPKSAASGRNLNPDAVGNLDLLIPEPTGESSVRPQVQHQGRPQPQKILGELLELIKRKAASVGFTAPLFYVALVAAVAGFYLLPGRWQAIYLLTLSYAFYARVGDSQMIPSGRDGGRNPRRWFHLRLR
jgi:hypothetical protein